MTTIKDGTVFDFTQRNKPVSKSVIIEDLNDFSSIHSLGGGAKGVTSSNIYKRIVFVLSGQLECNNRTTGHSWSCPKGSFTIFPENRTTDFMADVDTVALRIVVVNPTEIYPLLEDEKAYDLKELVPLHEDAASYVHILSCGNTKIWAVTTAEGKVMQADSLHSDMVYMCLEGEFEVVYDDKHHILKAGQCIYGHAGNAITLKALSTPTRCIVMKDIL